MRDGEVVPVTHRKLSCVHHPAEATHRERGMGPAVEENGEGSFWNPQPQPWYQSYSTGCILWGSPRYWVFFSSYVLGPRRYPTKPEWPARPSLAAGPSRTLLPGC